MNTPDLAGKIFGRLTVINRNCVIKKPRWNCLCECGSYIVIGTAPISSGNTKSCGCLNSDSASSRFRKHYLRWTPEYCSWQLMKDRCLNTNNNTFNYYGGRGITVCDRWLNSPITFVADMGLKPGADYTLDRINPNGNYEPSNCRWADKKTQSRNRRDSRRITVNGVTKLLIEWAEIYGIYASTIYKRIKSGMTESDAVTTKKRKNGHG